MLTFFVLDGNMLNDMIDFFNWNSSTMYETLFLDFYHIEKNISWHFTGDFVEQKLDRFLR